MELRRGARDRQPGGECMGTERQTYREKTWAGCVSKDSEKTRMEEF